MADPIKIDLVEHEAWVVHCTHVWGPPSGGRTPAERPGFLACFLARCVLSATLDATMLALLAPVASRTATPHVVAEANTW